MRIVTVRRISQAFFLAVFLWFCITATLGAAWYQLRGWPINWLLDLDPLTALATVLATGTLYATLAGPRSPSFVPVRGPLFLLFARPLGTLHQFTGWLGRLGHSLPSRVEANRHRRAQALKYYLLLALLALALMGQVQTGILDPLPLIHRSVNLALAPLADNHLGLLSDAPAPLRLGLAARGRVPGGAGPEPGLAPVLLPLHLPSRRAVRPLEPLCPLAHRQDLGPLRRLPHL